MMHQHTREPDTDELEPLATRGGAVGIAASDILRRDLERGS